MLPSLGAAEAASRDADWMPMTSYANYSNGYSYHCDVVTHRAHMACYVTFQFIFIMLYTRCICVLISSMHTFMRSFVYGLHRTQYAGRGFRQGFPCQGVHIRQGHATTDGRDQRDGYLAAC